MRIARCKCGIVPISKKKEFYRSWLLDLDLGNYTHFKTQTICEDCNDYITIIDATEEELMEYLL